MDIRPIAHQSLLRFAPGARRGRLTVIGAVEGKHFKRGMAVVFACRCDCGAEVRRDRQTLIKERDHSCDHCRRRSGATAPKGVSGEVEYKAWAHLIDRCTNPKNKSFGDYGARGITVCDRWLRGDGKMTGYECFVADMGRRPSPELSIERSNSDGPYSPGNCSWANRTIQNRNRRGLRLVTINGRTLPVSVWAEESGVPYFTLMQRLKRGMAPELAIIPGDHRKS